MNAVKIPGFTADASVYKTNSHYRLALRGNSPGHVDTRVAPQACEWYQEYTCGPIIGGGAVLCNSVCVEAALNPTGLPSLAGCYYCWKVYLGPVFDLCRGCLKEWLQYLLNTYEARSGGGDGGPPPPQCCPSGRTCRCSGTCQTVNGQLRCVGGYCLRPTESCP